MADFVQAFLGFGGLRGGGVADKCPQMLGCFLIACSFQERNRKEVIEFGEAMFGVDLQSATRTTFGGCEIL
jgi:hypothetical protein